MTSGPAPLWVIYDDPLNPWLCQARRAGEARTPMALGRTPLPTAHDRLLAQVTSGGRSLRTLVATGGLHTFVRTQWRRRARAQ